MMSDDPDQIWLEPEGENGPDPEDRRWSDYPEVYGTRYVRADKFDAAIALRNEALSALRHARQERDETAENARSLATMVDRLESERAQWEHDAKRYRWLRQKPTVAGVAPFVLAPQSDGSALCQWEDDLDITIDEAMASR